MGVPPSQRLSNWLGVNGTSKLEYQRVGSALEIVDTTASGLDYNYYTSFYNKDEQDLDSAFSNCEGPPVPSNPDICSVSVALDGLFVLANVHMPVSHVPDTQRVLESISAHLRSWKLSK